jgi:ferric-dicitrate binding protein FerR (iron transport regulator)
MKTDEIHDEPFADDADELFWLAMRYVQNELSDAERAEFETCLGDDDAACEAIVDAMRLTAGLNLASQTQSPLQLPSVSHPQTRRLLPVSISAALLLAIGLVFAFWPSSQPTETDLASAELVNRWRLDGHFASTEFHDGEDTIDEEAEILDESLSAPGWMMSAVRLSDELGSRP